MGNWVNHPNIAAIYGLEDSGTVKALVLELVEGPTLAEVRGTPFTRGRESTLEAEGQRSHCQAWGWGPTQLRNE